MNHECDICCTRTTGNAFHAHILCGDCLEMVGAVWRWYTVVGFKAMGVPQSRWQSLFAEMLTELREMVHGRLVEPSELPN